MKNSIQQAKDILKKANLYCTASRLAILETLLKAKKPLSTKQITNKLGKKHPDKTTIYRTLESLCKSDVLHKAYTHQRSWHFEPAHNCGKTKCHPHFKCINCQNLFCLYKVSFPDIKGLDKGFITHRQQLRLEGLCPECSNKINNS
ncbi:MAG: transcriptional repressor [Phycisphaerae bacterium]|nr:transcriptional repressor [Phycisphaerae bacterium]